MNVISNQALEGGLVRTTLTRDADESLLAYSTDGFYRVGPYVVSGHDVGVMQLVTWCAVDQKWKDQAP